MRFKFYIYLHFFFAFFLHIFAYLLHINAYLLHISAYFVLNISTYENGNLHIQFICLQQSAYNCIFLSCDCIFLHTAFFCIRHLLARFLAIPVPFQQALQQKFRVNS